MSVVRGPLSVVKRKEKTWSEKEVDKNIRLGGIVSGQLSKERSYHEN